MPPNEILGIQMCNSGFMHFYGRPIMALYKAAIVQPSALALIKLNLMGVIGVN